jgi:hypothetical protein
MKLINSFYCTQYQKNSSSTIILKEGESNIREELIRPKIIIIDTDGEKIDLDFRKVKIYSMQLNSNPYAKSTKSFTFEELQFLSKNYDFIIEEHIEYKNYYYSVLNINPLYISSGIITLIEHNNKEYIMIRFERWQFDYQPRSAGEDSLGEDITYVNGIWENPLLTDQIIAKIKQ